MSVYDDFGGAMQNSNGRDGVELDARADTAPTGAVALPRPGVATASAMAAGDSVELDAKTSSVTAGAVALPRPGAA